MLVHDHDVLTSQVEHVAAIVRGMSSHHFDAAALRDELINQVDLLKDQMLEHFAFEEEAAFPYLTNAMPEDAPRLSQMSAAHDRIARCLVEVSELLRLTSRETIQPQTGPIAATFERFVNHYRSHVREESEVLTTLQTKLSDDQRRELSSLAEKLV